MRPSPRKLVGAAAALATASAAVVVATQAFADPDQPDDDADTRVVNHEVFSPDGSITRADVTVPAVEPPAPAADVAAAEVTPIIENGPSDEKFDIVVVGDGYTEGELDLYEEHVRSKVDHVFSVEPFTAYKDQFNVWMVDVVSNESGVDNDPEPGVEKDTAMDMHFFCGDIERLLCVNETKANQYAAEAPGVDQVLALGNSAKYGGAGGDAATSSGGHADSGEIAVHEFGHSIGGLADEYDYGEDGAYDGPEVSESNVSIYDRATQEAEEIKWHQWMGEDSPDGGIVDTYDGARYYKSGIFRPTEDSIMRSLGNEFNLPGREAMVAAFHDLAAVASPSTPAGPAARGEELSVAVPEVPGPHEITWTVDGVAVEDAVGSLSLDTAALPADAGEVTVVVVDATDWVRDESLRAEKLTVEFTWQLD
ncbi:MAG: M64 family metallopeptidase [Stackebrandtia sp.]